VNNTIASVQLVGKTNPQQIEVIEFALIVAENGDYTIVAESNDYSRQKQ